MTTKESRCWDDWKIKYKMIKKHTYFYVNNKNMPEDKKLIDEDKTKLNFLLIIFADMGKTFQ